MGNSHAVSKIIQYLLFCQYATVQYSEMFQIRLEGKLSLDSYHIQGGYAITWLLQCCQM